MYIGYFLFSVFYIFSNFSNFALRKNINLIYNERVENKATDINFANYSVGVSIGITANNDVTKFPLAYEQLVLEINSITPSKINDTVVKSNKRYLLEKCREDNFYNMVFATFKDLGLSYYLCHKYFGFCSVQSQVLKLIRLK